MKLLLPFLAAAGVLANGPLLSRQIGQRDPTPGFGDWVVRHISHINEIGVQRYDTATNIIMHLKQKICKDTEDFMLKNNRPRHILAQIDGLQVTFEGQKDKLCHSYFEDALLVCSEIVDAVYGWCNAKLCLTFSSGLNPNSAFDYNVCLDYISPAAPIASISLNI